MKRLENLWLQALWNNHSYPPHPASTFKGQLCQLTSVCFFLTWSPILHIPVDLAKRGVSCSFLYLLGGNRKRLHLSNVEGSGPNGIA